MVLPQHVVRAARDGDIVAVEAFLDAEPGAINDRDEESELTLLMSGMNSSIKERHVDFARWLIARGADVNIGNIEDKLPLHYACYPGDCSSTMVSLLLASGARVNARTDEDEDLTPLGQLIEEFIQRVKYAFSKPKYLFTKEFDNLAKHQPPLWTTWWQIVSICDAHLHKYLCAKKEGQLVQEFIQ